MKLKFVTVSDKGQIAIPVDLREGAGIEEGDQLIMFEENGKIMLEKSSAVTKNLKDDFKDLLKISELSLKKLWMNEYDDIWDRHQTK